MAKKKRKSRPNIPIQSLARPRLEEVLKQHLRGDLDRNQFVEAIESLMDKIGRDAILNALVGALDNAEEPERKGALMDAIPKLGDKKTIDHLWSVVRQSKMSIGSKMTALVILEQMGEDVDIDDPGQYFSWKDIKNADLSEVSDLARFGLQAITKEVQQLKSADEVEGMMLRFEQTLTEQAGPGPFLDIVRDLVAQGDSAAADMLTAISATTNYHNIREAARKGLLKLASQNVFPQSEIIRSLSQVRFHSAYSTDPANPWQQEVVMLFERDRNLVQGLMFLLDFGHPWHGAIKDFYPTDSMPPPQIKKMIVDDAARHGIELRRITYKRARQFILEALEANKKHGVSLPSEYAQYRNMLERRVLEPSPETLAYAEKIDAQTEDEWGELPGKPMRGISVLTKEGEPVPLPMMDADWADGDIYEDDIEEWTLEDLLDDVDDFYSSRAEGQADAAAGQIRAVAPIRQEWMIDYLLDRQAAGTATEELSRCWDDLVDFMDYLDEDEDAPLELADLQEAQLRYFVTDFWEEEIDDESPLEVKKHAIDTIADLYKFLAEQNSIPAEAASRVSEAAKTLL